MIGLPESLLPLHEKNPQLILYQNPKRTRPWTIINFSLKVLLLNKNNFNSGFLKLNKNSWELTSIQNEYILNELFQNDYTAKVRSAGAKSLVTGNCVTRNFFAMRASVAAWLMILEFLNRVLDILNLKTEAIIRGEAIWKTSLSYHKLGIDASKQYQAPVAKKFFKKSLLHLRQAISKIHLADS